jgi:hypothetical protein
LHLVYHGPHDSDDLLVDEGPLQDILSEHLGRSVSKLRNLETVRYSSHMFSLSRKARFQLYCTPRP